MRLECKPAAKDQKKESYAVDNNLTQMSEREICEAISCSCPFPLTADVLS